MANTLLTDIGWLYPCDGGGDAVIRNAWILVRDGAVIEVGAADRPAPPSSNRISLRDCVVTPGFINLHHHFFQSLTRAVRGAEKSAVLPWLLTLYPVWVHLKAADLAAATRIAAAELLLGGCTTSVDHSYLVPDNDDEILEVEIAAARQMGLRLHLVVGAAPTLEGDLERRLAALIGPDLSRLISSESDILRQMERFARVHHDLAPGAMTRIALGPTGATYEKPHFMTEVAELAAAHGCGLHTHLHPRPDEREKARNHLGCGPIDFLKQAGWMRPGTWLAHCSQLTDNEIHAFAENGVGIAHCPRTIPRLGFPLTRVGAMRRHGASVGVGVDGSASNDSGSLLGDMRLALILHRIGTPAGTCTEKEWLEPLDVLHMATTVAASTLRRDDIGRIAPGYRADIAAFSMKRVDYAGGVTDPIGSLLMAGAWSRATLTMVDGRILVRDGRLMSHDEEQIAEEANASAKGLLSKAGKADLVAM
jgi:cytosine/adenosine deaminase-related metal-dependent hydrolase